MIDDGVAVDYTVLELGLPVYGSDEVEVGKLVQVVDNYRERIFDGLVIETPGGDRRFVDAPEVARTAERAVTLTIASSEVAALPPPDDGPPQFTAGRTGMLARVFGPWRKQK